MKQKRTQRNDPALPAASAKPEGGLPKGGSGPGRAPSTTALGEASAHEVIMEMEVSLPLECPFCGHKTELVVDTTNDQDAFTVDCEVCCRPFEVALEYEPGRVVKVTVDPG